MKLCLTVAACLGSFAYASGSDAARPAQGAEPRPATMVIVLPADAVLEIDGAPTKSTGYVRTFQSPPLPAGEKFTYTIKATWKDGDKLRTVEREITVTAGNRADVNLNPDELSADEKELLTLVNKERAKEGLAPYRTDKKLMRAARSHSANMARQGQLSHTLDEKGPAERLKEVGYTSAGWGENVAGGQEKPAEAMATWMNSKGHRGNILNDSYTEIGLGVATAADGQKYWTQVFAKPAGR
jgi:uncharacterized protein (TIGR03000 family)